MNHTTKIFQFLGMLLMTGFLVGSFPIQARSPSIGEIISQGHLQINGIPFRGSTSFVSGSSLLILDSKAVILLGKLGRVTAEPHSDLTITFDQVSVAIQLRTGTLRVQKTSDAPILMTTNSKCRIEVFSGNVAVNEPSQPSQEIQVGEVKEYSSQTGVTIQTQSQPTDYQVTTRDIPTSPPTPGPSHKAPVKGSMGGLSTKSVLWMVLGGATTGGASSAYITNSHSASPSRP